MQPQEKKKHPAHQPVDWNRLEEQLAAGTLQADSVLDSDSGFRLVHEAARRNDARSLSALLCHRADANARSCRDGWTPLHVCVEHASHDCMRVLLDAGRADPNLPNGASETPLHLAATGTVGSLPTMRALLAGGADCARVDCYGDNALHRACLEDNVKGVALLLATRPHLVNRPTGGDQRLTCLHIAANSENSDLQALLLRHGADFLEPDGRGRSAVDILLDKQDTTGIDCLGRHLIEEVRKFRHGEDIRELLDSPEARRYLEQLMRIDGICEPSAAATATAAELQTDDAGAGQEQQELQELRRVIACRKIDGARLVTELETVYQAGLTDALETNAPDLMKRLVELTVRLVLLPQEEALLSRLLACRKLWRCLAWRMQADVQTLYDRALRGSKAGIRQILRRECAAAASDARDSGSIDLGKLNVFLAEATTYWQFRRRKLHLATGVCTAMRDPLQSLALWSVLTGRLRLVPALLGQEEFDLVPLSLLTATLLRSLAKRRDVEDVFVDKADSVADQCEGMAIQIIKDVKEVDNSYGNNLTIAFVSMPLPNYANYTVLDLAARGCANSFIKLDIVELATDKSWYGDFFDFRQTLTRELIIAAGFLPPLMLLLPVLIQRMRNPQSRRFLETITEVSVTACHGEEEEREAESNEARATRVALLDDPCEHQLEHTQHAASGPVEGRMTCREFGSELLEFYGTPCVKFRISVVFSFAFVSMLSVMILSDFQGDSSPIELFCYCTIFGVFVEEMREMVSCTQQETLGAYLSDGWNVIDLIAVICGFLAFISRRISSSKFDFLAMLSDGGHERRSRDLSYVFIVITTLIFWIRVLFISIVLESVGVKLKMLSLMIKKDFIPFLYILVVIMLGFGIAFHALLWPNGQYYVRGRANPVDIDPPDILIQMFKRTFYTIVGEYGLDEMEQECMVHDAKAAVATIATTVATAAFNATVRGGRNATSRFLGLPVSVSEGSDYDEGLEGDSTNDGSEQADKCVSYPGSVLVPYVLMVIYIVIVQVLLLNVIVAMFSKTIDMVDSESKAMWLFERYDLTKEFVKRSALPAPFNIILELRNLAAWSCGRVAALCSGSSQSPEQQQKGPGSGHSPAEMKRQNFHNFVYLFYLFYQAVTLRRLRRKLDGMQADESELSSEGRLLLRQVAELRRSQADLKEYLESQNTDLSRLGEKLDRLMTPGGGAVPAFSADAAEAAD